MSPALCEHESPAYDFCAVLAVGRCHRCGRAFCESHRGDDQSILCAACRAVDAEAVRERRNVEAAKRAEAARRESRHAAAVAAREQKTGWALVREEVEMIDAWLAENAPGRHVSHGRVVFAMVLAVGALALVVPVVRAENLAFVLGLLACVLVWAGWTVMLAVRQHQRRRWRLERNRLLQARGCGVYGCEMCARDA